MIEDDDANNILATGALLAALVRAGLYPQVVMNNGQATNALTMRFEFLKSRYRLTVERIQDDVSDLPETGS